MLNIIPSIANIKVSTTVYKDKVDKTHTKGEVAITVRKCQLFLEVSPKKQSKTHASILEQDRR